jgi:glycosyltransferase involved in cell wall biosynthesis
MLAIVGDGPERTRLEERARQANLAEAVCFTGYRRDARRYLPGFDFYVNSSMYEGVSLTILEAMAASLPLVATRVGGTPEVVVDGQTGVLVPARDSAAMAAAITSLATHPDRKRAMGDSGRRRLERYFTIDRMVSDYLCAYRGNS